MNGKVLLLWVRRAPLSLTDRPLSLSDAGIINYKLQTVKSANRKSCEFFYKHAAPRKR